MSQVLIVGAGITGLTAAYEVHRRGQTPLVLEASSRAGGLIHTEQADGFTIEAGADSVLASKPAGVDLIRELGLSNALQDVRPPGGAFVLRGRRLYPLPRPSLLGIPLTWQGVASYALLPWHARLRLALERTVPPRPSGEDESVASFFRRRFGPDTVDLIAQPLLGGIHAGDIEQLSMASLFPRLVEMERRYGRVIGTTDTRRATTPFASPFQSLRNGMGTLIQALARVLPPDAVAYDTRVLRIARTADGWRVETHSTSGVRAVEARALILACPARVASTLLAPVDRESADLCARVPYVSTASIALGWPRASVAHPLRGTGFVVARPSTGSGRASGNVRITACTWVTSKWDGRAPDDEVLLRAFVGGAHDPDVVALPDEALASIARHDVARVLGVGGEPILTRVYRWRDAGAQHLVGHLDRVRRIEQRLANIGGIFVAGSGFRSVGIPDCVADARRAGEESAKYARGR
ncbi:MAG TPA: protoporphyrinogen oxidase [Chloroflexota bacterium]|nr:protoporphyrinogen oxidase [Chloroflexota bacterium]